VARVAGSNQAKPQVCVGTQLNEQLVHRAKDPAGTREDSSEEFTRPVKEKEEKKALKYAAA